ncbi:phage baseplate assembly protein V [Hyalangium versicolor]|uniref:phage baseplate assembly protein V n=1 Tax=Hyalangium versicolor TaxID=2861190 RepID=UPI001CCE5550|nr:phage baseplate assembly protein V [Hyalangium versicolor]
MNDTYADGGGPRYFGLYPALVTSIMDEKSLGRIEVKFPFLGDPGKDVRAWATLLTPYAGDNQGFEVLPEVGTQVVVGFEAGDLRRPYIVGACWNGQQALPSAPEEANNKRLIKTRSGSTLEFDDTQAASKVTLSLASGHKLVLDDGGKRVTLSHSNQSSITFEQNGDIVISANARLVITASSVMVQAPSTTHTGSVTCTALTATSVTSPLYSPGAGNVW